MNNVVSLFRAKKQRNSDKMVAAGYITDASGLHLDILPVNNSNEVTPSYDDATLFQVTRERDALSRKAIGMFLSIDDAILFDQMKKQQHS